MNSGNSTQWTTSKKRPGKCEGGQKIGTGKSILKLLLCTNSINIGIEITLIQNMGFSSLCFQYFLIFVPDCATTDCLWPVAHDCEKRAYSLAQFQTPH